MNYYGNMGPFDPVSFKGNAKISGVPTFVDKLPLTIGGIAGGDIPFGRVVSIVPTNNRREFVVGVPAGGVVKGISMLDPTIMRADPAQQKYYFAGRPMTATTMGLIDILEYDVSQSAPLEGSTVWCRNSDGILAFNDGTDISDEGYTKLNAYVYESLDPNGAKVAFGLPCLVSAQARETSTKAVVPVATPAAGAVASGTSVSLASTTEDAKIYYTLDGSTPSMESDVFDASHPIAITAAVTINAVAIADGHDPSEVLTAAYTIA